MTKLAKTTQFNRSGNVHYRVDQREDGNVAVIMAVDFEHAPVPERSYIADYFEVHRTEADVMMVFGKKNFPSETELRNKLEIYFPVYSFFHQLWKSSRQMHESLGEVFANKGKLARTQGDLKSSDLKVQTLTLTANNALVVISGGQCVMDFFLISAKDLWLKTKKGDPLNVEAIVRIFMSEHLLLGLLNRFDEIAKELKPEVETPEMEGLDDVESIELR